MGNLTLLDLAGNAISGTFRVTSTTAFYADGSVLRTNGTASPAVGSYSVSIIGTSNYSLSVTQTFTVNVTNTGGTKAKTGLCAHALLTEL